MDLIDALSIRAATPSDFADVDSLFQRSYPALLKADYPPSVYVTSIPIISRAQTSLLSSGRFFLAERDGALVGAGGWSPAAPGDGRQSRRGLAHVRHVVTHHRTTREGIGRALLGHVMADARHAGRAEMRCQSTLTAVPFYRAMGFEEVGPMTIELPRGIGFPAMLMRRLI